MKLYWLPFCTNPDAVIVRENNIIKCRFFYYLTQTAVIIQYVYLIGKLV